MSDEEKVKEGGGRSSAAGLRRRPRESTGWGVTARLVRCRCAGLRLPRGGPPSPPGRRRPAEGEPAVPHQRSALPSGFLTAFLFLHCLGAPEASGPAVVHGNGHSLNQEWQGLHIRRSFFTERAIAHRQGLPGEVVESPSLVMATSVALGALVLLTRRESVTG